MQLRQYQIVMCGYYNGLLVPIELLLYIHLSTGKQIHVSNFYAENIESNKFGQHDPSETETVGKHSETNESC